MSRVIVEGVQWRTLNDVDVVEPLGDHDYAVLSELEDVLIHHGVTNRFGVCLLHRHFDLADDEIAVEDTDVGSRVSTVVVRRASECSGDILETMWRFREDEEGRAVTVCKKVCNYMNGHKVGHKEVGQ